MTFYERIYGLLRAFDHPLYYQINTTLQNEVKTNNIKLLDVGGRTSNCTVGVKKCKVTVTELPRKSTTQLLLELGAEDELIKKIIKRRSNLEEYLYDDMTNTLIDKDVFDVATAIEVLEHVEEDTKFISNVCKVLKKDGIFIMTTPNGEYVDNSNPDHVRHYTRTMLWEKLTYFFSYVKIQYAVLDSYFFRMGCKKWSFKNPISTLSSMFGFFFSRIQSANPKIKHQSNGTLHLFAICKFPKSKI